MAEVDFSNARIEPYGGDNLTKYEYLNMDGIALFNSNFGVINSNGSTSTLLINEKKQLMYLCSGTFTQSGTEFIISKNDSRRGEYWKVSNISFSSGDTYVFQINATLVCN